MMKNIFIFLKNNFKFSILQIVLLVFCVACNTFVYCYFSYDKASINETLSFGLSEYAKKSDIGRVTLNFGVDISNRNELSETQKSLNNLNNKYNYYIPDKQSVFRTAINPNNNQYFVTQLNSYPDILLFNTFSNHEDENGNYVFEYYNLSMFNRSNYTPDESNFFFLTETQAKALISENSNYSSFDDLIGLKFDVKSKNKSDLWVVSNIVLNETGNHSVLFDIYDNFIIAYNRLSNFDDIYISSDFCNQSVNNSNFLNEIGAFSTTSIAIKKNGSVPPSDVERIEQTMTKYLSSPPFNVLQTILPFFLYLIAGLISIFVLWKKDNLLSSSLLITIMSFVLSYLVVFGMFNINKMVFLPYISETAVLVNLVGLLIMITLCIAKFYSPSKKDEKTKK